MQAPNILPRLWRQIEQTRQSQTVEYRLKEKLGLKQLIGESPSFRSVVERLSAVARCDATVLISGETGTGKEMCARAIHHLGPRAQRPFVPVNCGAIPTELIENEMFGHDRGAFTDAAQTRRGLICEADGGALFLDEIDSLPLPAQVKLLRFLQEKEYRPLGSTKTQRADVRVISASNSDLEQAVQVGRLRRDLYYRLNVIPLRLPPLRERREDIPVLSRHFLAKYAYEFDKPAKDISPRALRKLTRYDWPGNVRELENAIERAVALSEGSIIRGADLDLPEENVPVVATAPASFQEAKARCVAQFERDYLQELQQQLSEDAPFPAMIAHLNNETLPKLAAELEGTEGRPQYSRLRPWLESLTAELKGIATRAPAMRAESLAMEFTLAAPIRNEQVPKGGAGFVRALQSDQLTNVVAGLVRPPSVPPANARQLKQRIDVGFQPKADTGIQIAGAFQEQLRGSLPVVTANTKVTPDVGIKVYALRVKAALFGHNAPRQPVPVPNTNPARYTLNGQTTIKIAWENLVAGAGGLRVVALDAVYDQITAGNLVAIEHASDLGRRVVAIHTVAQTRQTTMEVVGMATKVSLLTLENAWLDSDELEESSDFLRGVTVYAQSEELPLAEEPIDDPICGSNYASDPNALIELDGLYSGLRAGRWLMVSGERTDIQVPDPDNPHQTVPVTGVKSSELVMLAEVI